MVVAEPGGEFGVGGEDAEGDGKGEASGEGGGPEDGGPAGLGEGGEDEEADQGVGPEEAGGFGPGDAAVGAVLREPAGFAAEGEAEDGEGFVELGDGVHEQHEGEFEGGAEGEAGGSAVAGAAGGEEQDFEVAQKFGGVEGQRPGEGYGGEGGAGGFGGAAGCGEEGGEEQDGDVEGCAEEHHDGLDELPAAHPAEAGQAEQVPVLQVAGEPAGVAVEEFGQGGGVGFLGAFFTGPDADAPAGGADAGGFDLVVGEDGAAVGEGFELAVGAESVGAQDGVVAPVGAFVALPEGLADGPDAHASAHAELEQAGEGGGGGLSDDEVLDDAHGGVGLHDADEAEDGGGGHGGVGVEHEDEVDAGGVVVEEVHDVAGLEAGVFGPAAVVDALRVGVGGTEGGEGGLFGGGGGGVLGVGQKPEGEVGGGAGLVEGGEEGALGGEDLGHVLVADGNGDGGGQGDVAGFDVTDDWQDGARGVLGEDELEEAEDGVGQADAEPGDDAEEGEEDENFGDAPAAGGEHLEHEPGQPGAGGQEDGEEEGAAGVHGRALPQNAPA